jgi:hypothetical protein
MTEEMIKTVIDATEKSHQERKQDAVREKVKKIVQEYLEHIDSLDEKIDELQGEKKQLKLTLEDLKSGKLDVLKERLEKDPKAKVNIIEIHEIHHHDPYNPFYTPWIINYPVYPTAPYNPIVPWQNPVVYCGATSGGQAGGTVGSIEAQFTVNGSDCKAYSVGTYTVSGNAVNFR